VRRVEATALSTNPQLLSGGIDLMPEGGGVLRVWAPACRSVSAVLRPDTRREITVPLNPKDDGFFSGELDTAAAGDRYWILLDDERRRPDPYSRYQPEGPHGPSEIVDPESFVWTDSAWQGVPAIGQVIYELHVGTVTPEGTWLSAMRELEHLVDLGVTIIEMMPVADFAGARGWGYDGVNLYAPTRVYGTPDDLRRFVDRAHTLGLAVILDVVYNHLGPDGNYLAEFSPDYFTERYSNDWGKALNFEGPLPARAFFLENAAYWIREYHFDGLRLDATQDIHDASAVHFLAELAERTRDAAGPREIYLVAENEPQESKLVRDPARGGFQLTSLWNDDYHHTAIVALTGRREAYYTDYKGTAQEFVSCAKYGYLYQGQWYAWQKKRRGTPALDLPGHAFVTFLENHDQVANTPFGRRLHQVTSPGRYRALTALTLLGPGTPMLFQGQEFASSAPFLFFCDHGDHLREPIRQGRREFLSQFPSITDPEVQAALPNPDDEQTFLKCKLDPDERERNVGAYRLHRDLFEIRRSDAAIAAGSVRRPDGAVLTADAFALRFDGGGAEDRLLLVNLGRDLELTPIPEPLLAPPAGCRWRLRWSSEHVAYGGLGESPLHPHPTWRIPGEAALLLEPEPDTAPAPPAADAESDVSDEHA
jgi:maltooligosyltrehalose trehalohydrolase